MEEVLRRTEGGAGVLRDGGGGGGRSAELRDAESQT